VTLNRRNVAQIRSF